MGLVLLSRQGDSSLLQQAATTLLGKLSCFHAMPKTCEEPQESCDDPKIGTTSSELILPTLSRNSRNIERINLAKFPNTYREPQTSRW